MIKRVLLASFVLLLIVGATIALSQTPKPSRVSTDAAEIGRYQIASGTYQAIGSIDGKAMSQDQHGVFRIDTQTGRTWIFRQIVGTGDVKSFMGWVPVDEAQR